MEPSVASANVGEELSYYMPDVGKFPLLSAEMEHSLCRRWIDHHDIVAAHQLVRSHVRLVAEIAMSYHGRGLPIEDLIGEGHVGLMRAVCRFDPDCDSRFATYAVRWVRAAIQQYILHQLVDRENGQRQLSEEAVLQSTSGATNKGRQHADTNQ